MSVNVTVNGVTYIVPQQGENFTWGTGQGGTPGLTALFQALAANTLQPTGGSFPLTADTNFGSSYGTVQPYMNLGSATRRPLSGANTATVQASTTGKLQVSENGSLYKPVMTGLWPEDFGAVGDGATDCTTAFQSMAAQVNSLLASNKSVALHFDNKVYIVNNTINFIGTTGARVDFIGLAGDRGFGGTVIRAGSSWSSTNTSTQPIFHLAGANNTQMRDICFDGNDKTTSLVHFNAEDQNGNAIASAFNTVERCVFMNVKHATSGTWGLGWGAPGSSSHHQFEQSENTIRQCIFSPENNFVGPNVLATGLNIMGVGNCFNYRVENCDFNGCNLAIQCSNGSFTNITGCEFEDCLTLVAPAAGGQTMMFGAYAETPNQSNGGVSVCLDNAGAPGNGGFFGLYGCEFNFDVSHSTNNMLTWRGPLEIVGCKLGNLRNSDGFNHPFFIVCNGVESRNNSYHNLGSTAEVFFATLLSKANGGSTVVATCPGAPHGLTVGQTINVALGGAETYFAAGNFTVATVPNSTSFTYSDGQTNSSGSTQTNTQNDTIVANYPAGNLSKANGGSAVTATAQYAHRLAVGQEITVTLGGAETYFAAGTFVITSVPSTTTFTYSDALTNSSGSTKTSTQINVIIPPAQSPFTDQSGNVYLEAYRRRDAGQVAVKHWNDGSTYAFGQVFVNYLNTQALPHDSAGLRLPIAGYPAGTGATVYYDGQTREAWTKITLTYQQFQTAALSKGVSFANVAYGCGIQDVKIHIDTPFSGGAIATCVVQVDWAADPVNAQIPQYVASRDATTNTDSAKGWGGNDNASKGHVLKSGDTYFAPAGHFNYDSTKTIVPEVLMTATGANLSALTAGQITVWMKTYWLGLSPP